MNEQIQRHPRQQTSQQPQQRISGMPCPECGGFIPISMYQIIASSSIFCPNCGLRLEINKSASSKAIDALKKVDAAQKEVDKRSKFNGKNF